MSFLRQNIADKFIKLSKIDFALCFTEIIWTSSGTAVGKYGFWLPAGELLSIPRSSGVFLKFPNFLISSVLSCLAACEDGCIFNFW